ncbi:MAG: histone deacetylase [Promethearchaeota archaeon]|nr:MAG: histone deacetylase [Candidatus Lokiarchaeota archaeon]
MTQEQKIGIIIDEDFAKKHAPPYPRPMFLSFETPLRIKVILDCMDREGIWKDDRIIKIKPKIISDDLLKLAHTTYYIESIKRLSKIGGGLLGDEVYVTGDTYELAKKAAGGAIVAIEQVIQKQVNQAFAIVRPPGHHALREMGSGLCIFNNIAISILYLRKILKYEKKIAIIDIDDHFGDGLVQYFYDDPSVLYFSVHEFDFVEGDIGFVNELGEKEGIGKSINFPIPYGITDEDFLEFMEVLEPILYQFTPDLIIVATGFDMHFDDTIGNCFLTSRSYYNFAQRILKIAEDVCGGKVAFILEGGYSLMGLPLCANAVLKALLKEKYEQPSVEMNSLTMKSKTIKIEIEKIKNALFSLLQDYWNFNVSKKTSEI